MNIKKIIPPLITLLLFFIPFFWFKPGEMDIGGDSSRLYFYDPLSYLQTQTLYGIISSGVGGETVSYYALPYMLMLAGVKIVISSPTVLIGIFHGLSLSAAFLSCYLIVKELLREKEKKGKDYIEFAALLAGLFYIFTPTLTLGWDKEILTHNQIFLNPVIFYFLLLFVIRDSIKYLFIALLISFLFAPNFSFVAAPPFFAFYPLAIVFLLLYARVIRKESVSLKKIIVGFVLFLALHLFHLGSHFSSLFAGGSQINENVFSAESKFSRGLSYFTAVAASVKVSFSWMNLPQLTELTKVSYGFIIFPLIILLGFIWNRKKLYLLTAIFFLITFFFVTANITNVGFSFYKKLFDIPGFSMFRNYFGQWVFVFTFFYMLLFAQALQTLFEKIKLKYTIGISVFIVSLLVANAWPFINGSLLNKIHFQSKNVKIPSTLDAEYEKVLSYIRALETDGKFISFPLTGPGYQIIMGTNGGAYQGPSTISYLTGKNDFTGYDGLIPYNDIFLTLVRNNDINGINRLFSILNIKYIFYNSDPKIYDDNFPKYPYDYVRDKMPATQAEYKTFIEKLPIKKVKDFGKHYHIYEVNEYLPHFYIADSVIYSTDALTPFFVLNLDESLRSVVYTNQEKPQNDSTIILKATNASPLLELFNNYHLHIHSPFIARRMDDPIYPFVIWKENNTLEKLQTSPTEYIDYSLLYLTKRISELDMYKDTPVVYKDFIKPKIWEFYKGKEYYSWESTLSRYQASVKKLITWIESAPVSDATRNSMKIKVNSTLSYHESQLFRLIYESPIYSERDKRYLSEKNRSIFNELYTSLNLALNDNSQVVYTLELPTNMLGDYISYLRSEKDVPLDPTMYTLKVEDTVIKPVNLATQSALIQFEPVTIKTDKPSLTLQYTPKNLFIQNQWMGVGTVAKKEDETIFTINDQFGARSGFSHEINNFRPDMQYVITFEYYIEGDDLQFIFKEKQKQDNKFSTATYFNKLLPSKKWQKEQFIITSSPTAINGYLQFITFTDNYSGKLHLKNISVTAVPNDTLLVKKVTDNVSKKSIPTLQFKKINPTRYALHVSNAQSPYDLVFSESFSNNWKLYLSDNSQKIDKVTKTYFGNAVQEAKHENNFFALEYLQNGKMIAEATHTSGNGYANVWKISPHDVENKKDYDLLVVYNPQNYFYYYLAISIFTAIGIMIYLLFAYIRKK